MKNKENIKTILRKINNYFFQYKNGYENQDEAIIAFADIDLLENSFAVFTQENDEILRFNGGNLLDVVIKEIDELKEQIYRFLKSEVVDISRIINLSDKILYKIDNIEYFLKNYDSIKKILL
jgi:hypothetical protein